jgi:polyisoprenyl-phosphate glycosyltransferase
MQMILTIVIPCYNEEAVLPETVRRLDTLLDDLINFGLIAEESHAIFVDDGSRDQTWRLICEAATVNSSIRGIKLSRNRGHQNAVLAGMFEAKGDAVISIDADLQDDVNAIKEMIEAFRNRSDIVYGIRKRRDSDSFFKRITAEGYYRLLARFGVEVVFNHADFRLMSRRAIDALRRFDEVNLFLRGIVPQLGFPSSIVYYDRTERFSGTSKYPLNKMLSLAWQGITSFSIVPLHIITLLGFTISLGSLVVTLWAVAIRLFSDVAIPGWASTVVPIYLLGGIQLLSLGVIGEYIAKIYMETKRRPRFFIDEKV